MVSRINTFIRMQKTISRSIPYYALMGIIVLGVVLRLIKLEQLFHFTYDEEIFAFVGKRMFINGHLPLIGGVTPMHVHVAPYFYWLSGILLFISQLNPIGWGIIAALLSGITMIVLFKLAKSFFNKKIALITVFLYSFSFYQNIFDRHYWGLVFDGLVSLISIYCLFQIINHKQKYFYYLVLALGFGIHTDLSTLTLLILSAAVLWFFRPAISRPVFVKGSLIFLLSFLPLLVFDLKHDFVNSKGILQYIQEIRQSKLNMMPYTLTDVLLFVPRSLTRLLYVFGNTDLSRQYSYCPDHALGRLTDVPFIATIFVLSTILYFFISSNIDNKNAAIGKKLLLMLFVITSLCIIVYGLVIKGDLFDHYLATVFPVFFLVIAGVLYKILNEKPILITILLLVFSLTNVYQLVKVQHRFGYQNKIKAVRWAISTTGSDSFSLDVLGSCFRYNGYRYLFYAFGKEPDKSYVDANFTHLYDKPPSYQHPKYLIVITNADFAEKEAYFAELNHLKSRLIVSTKFNHTEVLLIDNQNLDFVGKF